MYARMNTIIQSIISIFNTTVEQVRKYGKGLVLWCVVLFAFIGMMVYFLHQNEILLDKFINQQQQEHIEHINKQEEQHIQQVTERRELNSKIYNVLNKFFYTHQCVQTVAVMEYHNGSSNLAKKAFLYVSNTFELCKGNDSHFSDIQRMNISLFNISNILYQNAGYYQSSVEQLKNNDIKLYSIVSNIDTAKHIYIIEVQDINNIAVAAIVVISNQDYSLVLESTIKILKENISLLII